MSEQWPESKLKHFIKRKEQGVSIAELARRNNVAYHVMHRTIKKYERRQRQNRRIKNIYIACSHMQKTISLAIAKLGINPPEDVREFMITRLCESEEILDGGKSV